MKRFSGKNILITGGSQGIGKAIALAFANEGARLILVGRDPFKLASMEAETGTPVLTYSCDLSCSEQVLNLAEKLNKDVPVDVLINNAGTATFTPFHKVELGDFDQMIDINIKAPYFLSQALLASLTESKGSIINISSYFSHKMIRGRPSSLYSLSKGALDAATRSLAFELGARGVRVNAVAPGTVSTPLFENTIDSMDTENRTGFIESLKTSYPLGRIGKPEDIAGIVLFLCSDEASWITGGVFPVDGGLTVS